LVINRQHARTVNLAAVRDFVGRLRTTLRVGRRDFTICFVDDRQIRQLNAAYRGKPRPTDVLSFPWKAARKKGPAPPEYRGYLGDVVISLQAARRNARAEGHSTQTEISGLILHGVLHLLGYDHEKDHGEMAALERSVAERLGSAGALGKRRGNLRAVRLR
jgi:probable rRNA maturation factor